MVVKEERESERKTGLGRAGDGRKGQFNPRLGNGRGGRSTLLCSSHKLPNGVPPPVPMGTVCMGQYLSGVGETRAKVQPTAVRRDKTVGQSVGRTPTLHVLRSERSKQGSQSAPSQWRDRRVGDTRSGQRRTGYGERTRTMWVTEWGELVGIPVGM